MDSYFAQVDPRKMNKMALNSSQPNYSVMFPMNLNPTYKQTINREGHQGYDEGSKSLT